MEPTDPNEQIHANELGFPLRGALIHYSKFQNINNWLKDTRVLHKLICIMRLDLYSSVCTQSR